MSYQYHVLSHGVSSFSSSLEGYAGVLEEMLNSPRTRELMDQGYEVWRIERFTEDGARGFVLVLRRAN